MNWAIDCIAKDAMHVPNGKLPVSTRQVYDCEHHLPRAGNSYFKDRLVHCGEIVDRLLDIKGVRQYKLVHTSVRV